MTKCIARTVLLFAFCIQGGAAPAWGEIGKLLVVVQDAQQRPMRGVEIGVEGGGGSKVTGDDGKALLPLTKDTDENDWVSLQILHSPPGKDLAMLSPYDNRTLVPSFKNKAENFVRIVVIQRGDLAPLRDGNVVKAITEEIIKKVRSPNVTDPKSADQQAPQESPKATLEAAAQKFGLSAQDLDGAIRAWGAKTTDPYEAGVAALFERNYTKATVDLKESLRQREQGLASNETAVGITAFYLGQSLSEQGNYKESALAFERSLSLFQTSNNRQNEALTLLRLGQLNARMEQPETFEKAIGYFTRALLLFKAASDRFNEAMCWWGIGTASDRLGRTQPAQDAYLKALPFFTEKKDGRVLGRLFLDIGEDEDALGNLQKAVDYYEQALPLLTGQGDELSRGMALTHLGLVHQKVGDSAGAIDTFKAAIGVWHSAGDKASEATAYLMLGTNLSENHDWQGVLNADSAAFKLSEGMGDRSGQASALFSMARVHYNLGEYKNALDLSLQT